jgi:hypothetical protein
VQLSQILIAAQTGIWANYGETTGQKSAEGSTVVAQMWNWDEQ